jgi:hypothetical protein
MGANANRAQSDLRPRIAPNRRCQPFRDAEEAWLWTMAALMARREGARFRANQGLVVRPCEPDDVVKCLDGALSPAPDRPCARAYTAHLGRAAGFPESSIPGRALRLEVVARGSRAARVALAGQGDCGMMITNRKIYLTKDTLIA